jgi:RHH-type rel operon transcriptional repressor/antitoxin RelB
MNRQKMGRPQPLCDTLNTSIQGGGMPTSIRLPDDIEKRLDLLAQRTGRTKAFYIREIILEHLDDLEDYYLAADRAERVRKGREKTVSSKQLRKDLGLDD